MIITYLVNGEVKELIFDAVVSETHSSTVAITSHPVEKGAVVSDHIRPDPERLSVEAWVSDTPLTPSPLNGGADTTEDVAIETSSQFFPGPTIKGTGSAAIRALRFEQPFGRVREVYSLLKQLQRDGTLVGVKTLTRSQNQDKAPQGYLIGLADYESMAIANLSVPRSVQNGSAIGFGFDLIKVRIVETSRVDITIPAMETKHEGEKGKKDPPPGEKKQERASFAKQAAKAVGLIR